MNDADWADAAAWVKTTDRSIKPPLSTKDLAQFPRFDGRPYARSGGTIMSSGGVVKSVKPEKDALTVALEKTRPSCSSRAWSSRRSTTAASPT